MKRITLTLLVCICLPLLGQTPEQPPDGLQIGLVFSPDYCYRMLVATEGDFGAEFVKANRDTLELPRLGFTTGLSLLMKLGNRLVLESGILFADMGERTKRMELTYIPPKPERPNAIRRTHHYLYMDVPVRMNYYFIKKRLAWYVGAGISAKVALTYRLVARLEYSDGSTETTSSTDAELLKRLNVAATAGMGLSYALSQCLAIRLEPTFRHAIKPNVDKPIKGYLYSAGVTVGLLFRPSCRSGT